MSSYTTVPAMNKGVQMFLKRILDTKSATHLREIEIELRAVESMYDRSIISITQLEDLQKSIVTKTAEPKPVITTNAARSVTELQQLHNDIATASASTPEPKRFSADTRACWPLAELVQDYFDNIAKSSIIISRPVIDVQQNTVLRLAEGVRNRQIFTDQSKQKALINTRAVNTVSELIHVFRGSLRPSIVIKPELIIRSQQTVSELTKKLSNVTSTLPVKPSQVLNLSGNVAERITCFKRMLDDSSARSI